MPAPNRPKQMFIKPAEPGLIVRDPDRGYQPLPATGSLVNPTQYWRTMLRDKAVVECEPPAKAAAAPPAPAARRPGPPGRAN